jgi:hypothetical protein
MSSSLSSFQSVIQLASGANLAIFALPELGQAELNVEAKRWQSTIGLAQAQNSVSLISFMAGRSEFHRQWSQLVHQNALIRRFALFVSIVCGLYLIRMSAFPDLPPELGTYAVLLLGLVPPIILLGKNHETRKILEESRNKRTITKI